MNIYINPPSSEKTIDDFKPTPIKQNENPDNIRKYLNKITEKNYHKYEDMIINNIKKFKMKTSYKILKN